MLDAEMGPWADGGANSDTTRSHRESFGLSATLDDHPDYDDDELNRAIEASVIEYGHQTQDLRISTLRGQKRRSRKRGLLCCAGGRRSTGGSNGGQLAGPRPAAKKPASSVLSCCSVRGMKRAVGMKGMKNSLGDEKESIDNTVTTNEQLVSMGAWQKPRLWWCTCLRCHSNGNVLTQPVFAGFDELMVQKALAESGGDLSAAVEILTAQMPPASGSVPGDRSAELDALDRLDKSGDGTPGGAAHPTSQGEGRPPSPLQVIRRLTAAICMEKPAATVR